MTDQPAASADQPNDSQPTADTPAAEAPEAAEAAETTETTETTEATEPSLEALVGSWLTVPDVAERLGIALSAVRRLIEERELLSARIGERRVVAVPEQFLHDEVFRHLRGTFTVLADGGLDDEEILRWLFTPDPTLRVPGTPVDNLEAGFKTEVRRRAMEQAF